MKTTEERISEIASQSYDKGRVDGIEETCSGIIAVFKELPDVSAKYDKATMDLAIKFVEKLKSRAV